MPNALKPGMKWKKSGDGRTWAIPIILLAAALAILLLAGCGSQSSQDTTVNANFPEFVYRSEQSLEGYKIAVAYPETLKFVPCYCGCQQDAQKYQNLQDCFIDRQTGDYDEHAAGCTTCLDEAMDIGQWEHEGLSTREIRDRIDVKYSERGEPTDTPMPSE